MTDFQVVVSVPPRPRVSAFLRDAPAVVAIRVGVEGPPGPVADEDLIADEVEAYLLAHPVTTGLTVEFATPLGSWNVSHGLGRRPTVELYLFDGTAVEADVAAPSTSQVVVTWTEPTSGYAVLS